jgi:hypothetical protein
MTRVLLVSCSVTEPLCVWTVTLVLLTLVILPVMPWPFPLANVGIAALIMASPSDKPAIIPRSVLRFIWVLFLSTFPTPEVREPSSPSTSVIVRSDYEKLIAVG